MDCSQPWDFLSMGFSRKEYWNKLPFNCFIWNYLVYLFTFCCLSPLLEYKLHYSRDYIIDLFAFYCQYLE